MDHNFAYRQKSRKERLERRRRESFKRRVRMLATFLVFGFLFITVISANSIIANAGQGYEKEYEKLYTSVMVERGETVWNIAEEMMTPGYDSIEELIEEIGFINNLDDTYSIQSGTRLIIPYYGEI